MRGIGGIVGLVVVAAIVLVGYKTFLTRAVPEGEGVVVATQAINITGVKNDLLAIARAEQLHFAQHGSYATLEELISSGALTMQKPGRDGYSYSVEVQSSGFTATARYEGPSGLRYPTLAIDQTMQIRELP